MGFLGHYWIIGLLIVVLIIFGPGKLPQIGGAVGTAIKEFRKATSELKDEVTRSTSIEPTPPAPPTAAVVDPAPATPVTPAAGVTDPARSAVVSSPAHQDKPELPKA